MSMQGVIKSITTTQILNKKGVEKITMLTAYDALMAKIFDGEVDMILVGDSLQMSFFGDSDTLSSSLDAMIYHTKAVCSGAKQSLVICDMPFGSTITPEIALESAIRVYKETKAQAVKLEVGLEGIKSVEKLVGNGIAVMAHIGLKPQFVRSEGGYKVQGKTQENVESLISLAKQIEQSGAFSILLEGVKAEAAKQIAQSVKIPIIGIGSGVDVDGQVLVWSDAFGFFEEFKPKFVRQYLQGARILRQSVRQYVQDVKSGDFPNTQESY
ncbi:3-methyl-2-oxobutanoate hydroxymethyltransferase [Helicobacter sp. MIT 05-5294]|uniref:3-methyl-2-oxobutanoate hydroxymethyltransferase n=1 Tax=Helicobacter sp. MIT 05-5294 TaxID=1548150 RepID=UPI00051FA7C1|nr:3-methyl-2-oxobutanoate hydroxymethyltransferase [Helicobacter sp. MIT 05-5294]TLD88697.1 3-methyl-2-oxobutanoate hydroxymethyltransferase [Helicobacter sp. MIT 05-5294]